jgi:hypothetical protein
MKLCQAIHASSDDGVAIERSSRDVKKEVVKSQTLVSALPQIPPLSSYSLQERPGNAGEELYPTIPLTRKCRTI